MAKNLIDPVRGDLWANGALLLKGEHKRTEAELNLAISEFVSKMNGWNPVALRGLPMLPCFAVGGRHIQFCAIIPPRVEGFRHDLRTVSPIYNTGNSTSRLSIIRMSLNMLRVLVVLSRRVWGGQISLCREIPRANDSPIVVMYDHVVKCCPPASAAMHTALASPDHLPFATRVTPGKRLRN
jgi:hypothetical protein